MPYRFLKDRQSEKDCLSFFAACAKGDFPKICQPPLQERGMYGIIRRYSETTNPAEGVLIWEIGQHGF